MKTESKRKMYMGACRFMVTIPLAISNMGLEKGVSGARAKAGALTEEEREVHHFVVKKMAVVTEPITAELISEELDMPLEKVEKTIDKLESLKTFVYRSDGTGVDWAYPLSLDDTGHRMNASTGESFNAAWAIDAFATPFVYGSLQDKELTFTIKTKCANSGRDIQIDIDSEMNIISMTEGADPWYSMALINTGKMKEKSIVDVFWRRSVFFWSEEDARQYQRKTGKQLFYMNVTRVSLDGIKRMQAAIFDFDK